MKIQCDVCEKEEASVFCAADEAALCDGCDHRVHHANKLATKHQRFPLLHPCSKDAPRCDICQERRAFLFCRQDRAILCRECDIQIHKTNQHTQSHHRFLLTGVKISSSTTSKNSNTSSEYLMDDNMHIPGWTLEDLLHSSSAFQSKNSESMKNNVNTKSQVEETSMGSYDSTEEYSRMWEFHPQEPLVPSHLGHLPLIFLDT